MDHVYPAARNGTEARSLQGLRSIRRGERFTSGYPLLLDQRQFITGRFLVIAY